MPHTVKLSHTKTTLAETRGLVELCAAEAGQDAAKSGSRFKMTLYTGEVVTHYNWSRERVERVVLDVAGFNPKRQNNLPAMADHWQRVGTIDAMAASGSTITATGRFLQDAELFEASARVQKILAEGHAMQCSGRWVPIKIEDIQAGASAKVNGQTVEGPISIWREFSIREGSFCDMGRDEMTEAELAASAKNQREEFAPELISNASNPEKKHMNKDLLASLKNVFGADKAIDLLASKPDATDLGGFTAELVAHIGTLNADLTKVRGDLTAAQTELTQVKSDLKAAQAAPPITTVPAGNGAGAPVPPAGRVDLNAMADGPDKFKAEFEQLPHIKAQFESVEVYAHYRSKGNAVPAK